MYSSDDFISVVSTSIFGWVSLREIRESHSYLLNRSKLSFLDLTQMSIPTCNSPVTLVDFFENNSLTNQIKVRDLSFQFIFWRTWTIKLRLFQWDSCTPLFLLLSHSAQRIFFMVVSNEMMMFTGSKLTFYSRRFTGWKKKDIHWMRKHGRVGN